jgi:hypothetical protein
MMETTFSVGSAPRLYKKNPRRAEMVYATDRKEGFVLRKLQRGLSSALEYQN